MKVTLKNLNRLQTYELTNIIDDLVGYEANISGDMVKLYPIGKRGVSYVLNINDFLQLSVNGTLAKGMISRGVEINPED